MRSRACPAVAGPFACRGDGWADLAGAAWGRWRDLKGRGGR